MRRAADGGPAHPPEPHAFERRFRLPRGQLAGVLAMAAIPVAALTGAFGLRSGDAQASIGDLQLQVHHPTLLRYKTSLPMEITVRNTGGTAQDGLTLAVDNGYLAKFSNVQLRPEPDLVTAGEHALSLGALPPGTTRRLVARLEADDYGRHAGRAVLRTTGGAQAEVHWSTVVLP